MIKNKFELYFHENYAHNFPRDWKYFLLQATINFIIKLPTINISKERIWDDEIKIAQLRVFQKFYKKYGLTWSQDVQTQGIKNIFNFMKSYISMYFYK